MSKISTNPIGVFVILILFQLLAHLSQAQNAYFFPKTKAFDPKIPTPEQFLGYPIGSRQTRYDRVVAYLQELDRVSDKVASEIIGYTYEHRPQLILTVTSPENHGRLEDIRQTHLKLTDPAQSLPNLAGMPVFVHLGYNVHGNESSSTEVSMLTAYYLTANTDEETGRYLRESVVFIDPALNPDGRDRHTSWVNEHLGTPPVADPADREHNEVWPGGRGNHYWFDLNRDWLPVVHVETKNRLRFYQRWYPNVVIDFHEMGTNNTYYFEPSKPYGSESPLVPRSTYDGLNVLLAKYYARVLDELGSLYFTKEQFDNIYPGYGSTYPDFQGGVGITFEQASSRGNAQENSVGVLHFAFTIRNHLATGLATVQGAVENREIFLKHQKEFYQSALTEARKNPVKAYLVGDAGDAGRYRTFAELLRSHAIEFYETDKDQTVGGKKFAKGASFVVPTEQPQYRMVQSVFEKNTQFVDSIFYDASAWSSALAYGLPYSEIRGGFTKVKRMTEAKPEVKIPPPTSYAYLLDWSDYHAPGALYRLLSRGVVAQTAFKPFTATTSSGPKQYGYGTVSIPVRSQKIPADSLHRLIAEGIGETAVSFESVTSGFSAAGIDLGSNNVRTVKKPEALVLVGNGTQSTEVGEVWFLLDSQLKMPITKVELPNFGRLNLSRYNTLVMVSGVYTSLDKSAVDKIKRWVGDGGTLITFKSASEWAIRQGLAKGKTIPVSDTAGRSAAAGKLRVDFENAGNIEGAKNVGGSIYEVDVDPTHPLGFGYVDRKLPVYRNGTVFLEPSANAYGTPVRYVDKPLLSGYISKGNLRKLSNSAAVLVSSEGTGRVILFADNPNFRGTWYGTNRLFLNALLFGQNITTPGGEVAEEE